MANLMLTKQCNLHCPYCFANEYVNKSNEVMDWKTFVEILSFLSEDPNEHIGLIGGEPTLHPDFRDMLAYLINSNFRFISLYTNGIVLEPYFNELRDSRFHILTNLNSPERTGAEIYDQIVDQMDTMINHLYMKNQISIGINLYKENQDYEYFLDVIKRFRFKKVRVSVAVPNLEQKRSVSPLSSFNMLMPTIRRFVKDITEIGTAPIFDCNYIPPCLITDDDREFCRRNMSVLQNSNLFSPRNICKPVIDILPNLDVIRCFALSDYHKVSLRDFKNIRELRNHFSLAVDGLAYAFPPESQCAECREYLAGNCSCGCLAYRLTALKAYEESHISKRQNQSPE